MRGVDKGRMTDWRRGAEGQAELGSASEALEELPKKGRPGRKDCENQKPRARYRGDGYSNGNRHELGQGGVGRGLPSIDNDRCRSRWEDR